jgi:integrase
LASLNGRSPGTKRNIIRVLNPIMKQALQEGEIASNPVTGVKVPRTPRNDDLRALDYQQVEELADEVGPTYRALILTAAYTGLQAGELAALRVKDLDLLHKRLRVRESISDVNHEHTKECKPLFGTLHLVPPKNGRTRNLALPAFLTDILEEQLRGKSKEGFVFGGATPMRHGNFYTRHFRAAVIRLVESQRWSEDLADLRFHDLRHTAASLLIKNGEHPKAVHERLGHSSITITMDRYGHLYEGHDTEIADRLQEAYLAAFAASR